MEENNQELGQNKQKEVGLGVPAAIVIAGVVIAGAILFVFKNNSEPIIIDQPYAQFAKQVGVSVTDFQKCMDGKEFDRLIDNDSTNAIDTGGSGTPWTLVVTKQGSVYPMVGALPYDSVKQVVDLALKDAETGKVSIPKDSKLSNYRPVGPNDHLIGDKNAPVTLIEYSDFQCPFCRAFHPTPKRVLTDYDGKVNWVYRHFPLEAIHSNARPMAHAAECVNKLKGNEAFWNFADLLLR